MFTGRKENKKSKRLADEEDIISSASNFTGKPMKSKEIENKPIRMSYADVVKLNLDGFGNVSAEDVVPVSSHRSSLVSSTPRSEYQSDNEGKRFVLWGIPNYKNYYQVRKPY